MYTSEIQCIYASLHPMSESVREVRVRHPKILYLVQLTWVKVEKGNNKQGHPSFWCDSPEVLLELVWLLQVCSAASNWGRGKEKSLSL